MSNEYHILCSTDDNYAQHCAVLMCSVYCNNSGNIIFHIVESNLSDDNKIKLRKIADGYNQRVFFHNFTLKNKEIYKLGVGAACSIVTYYRIFITSIIDDPSIDRILYLDCDIVVNSDISELFKLNFADWPIAAVRDVLYPVKDTHRHNIGLGYNDRYFNAGVLLFNLNMWREKHYEDKLIKFCEEDHYAYFADQDALNSVFRDRWLELSPSWNRFNLVKYKDVYFKTKEDELAFIYNPKIIHYASPTARPWMKLKFVPFSRIYINYLSKTPWHGTKKNDVKKTTRYKAIIKTVWSNFLYRSPLIIRVVFTSMFDIVLIVFHIIKHKSLRYYSPYKN